MVHKQSVLSLYRRESSRSQELEPVINDFSLELLRYGRKIQHTDKEYYFNRLRQEFVNNKDVAEADIPFCLKQGRLFLQKKNVV